MTVNDSVSACCRGGVGLGSEPHRVILETLKMVLTADMSISEGRGECLCNYKHLELLDKSRAIKGFLFVVL